MKQWYDSSIILISKENIAEELELDDTGFDSDVLISWSIPFTPNVSSSLRSYVPQCTVTKEMKSNVSNNGCFC